MLTRLRPLVAFFAVAAALTLIVVEADARPRSSIGSRGSRTFSAPPATATTPNAARPIERSMTQPGTAARPAASPAGGFFNRPGLLGGLAAGFLGAGLLGMLMGHGFLGGLGGFASFLGLLLQAGIVAFAIMMLWRWWQRRSQPAAAMAGGPALRDIAANGAPRANLGGAAPQAASPSHAGNDAIGLTAGDFDTFERLLNEIQTAYGKEELSSLHARVTPEMLSYFSEDLTENASRGVINQISDVKLLQGDLAEAWRESGGEYATVAMRYSLVDRVVERAGGRLIEGGDGAQEVTELWTFRRAPGGVWLLSAIQEA